jgi:hypothetical protein
MLFVCSISYFILLIFYESLYGILGGEMNNYEKCKKFADSLIKKAENERDKKGYRENLGYDSVYKLEDKMSKLDLNHKESSDLKVYFHEMCDKI